MADARALFEVAEELYSAPPGAFTPTRNARAAAARKAGDRALAEEIASLRKPSAPAWASNALFRSAPGIVEELAELREHITSASDAGDRQAVRESAASRHALIARLVDEARSLASAAGSPLSPTAADGLTEALTAALGDAQVADVMATGRLIAPPGTGGMTRSDLAEIVALPPVDLTRADPDDDPAEPSPSPSHSAGRSTSRKPSRRGPNPLSRSAEAPSAGPSSAERRRHERELRLAEERAESARAERQDRQRSLDDATRRRDEIADEVTRQRDTLRALENRLDDAETDVDALAADIRSRELDWKRAESAARSARRVVEDDDASGAPGPQV